MVTEQDWGPVALERPLQIFQPQLAVPTGSPRDLFHGLGELVIPNGPNEVLLGFRGGDRTPGSGGASFEFFDCVLPGRAAAEGTGALGEAGRGSQGHGCCV